MLVLFFLSSLHWPAGAEDMGHFGVSYLDIIILFEHWAGHRLLSEKVTRPHVRAHPEDSTSCLRTLKLTVTLEAAQDAQRLRRVGERQSHIAMNSERESKRSLREP